jgi:hypothetical protein
MKHEAKIRAWSYTILFIVILVFILFNWGP